MRLERGEIDGKRETEVIEGDGRLGEESGSVEPRKRKGRKGWRTGGRNGEEAAEKLKRDEKRKKLSTSIVLERRSRMKMNRN